MVLNVSIVELCNQKTLERDLVGHSTTVAALEGLEDTEHNLLALP